MVVRMHGNCVFLGLLQRNSIEENNFCQINSHVGSKDSQLHTLNAMAWGRDGAWWCVHRPHADGGAVSPDHKGQCSQGKKTAINHTDTDRMPQMAASGVCLGPFLKVFILERACSRLVLVPECQVLSPEWKGFAQNHPNV